MTIFCWSEAGTGVSGMAGSGTLLVGISARGAALPACCWLNSPGTTGVRDCNTCLLYTSRCV
ncbi:hypothetical protein [Erwinia amylovora]